MFCDQGTVYGGADAVNLHQFLRLQYGLSGSANELPTVEPVWMGEPLLRSHARSGANLAARLRYDEAVVELRRALQLNPQWPQVAAQLAWLLATCPEDHIRDGEQAVYYARLAMRFAEQEARERNSRRVDPVYHEVLAAAYAEQGEFDSALAAADKAVDGHLINGNKQQALAADEQRKVYLRHEPLRATELKPPVADAASSLRTLPASVGNTRIAQHNQVSQQPLSAINVVHLLLPRTRWRG